MKKATRTEDFVTIASIIKREIQKRKKQKKPKDELINCIPISNASVEDETELILLKKKKKKKKEDKKKVQNNKKLKNDKSLLMKQKFYTENCDGNNKHLIKDETEYSNLSKDEFTKKIPIANTSEGHSLFKKKKKKKKRDKIMARNDISTLKEEKFYTEICDDNNKHLIKDKTGYSYLSKDEFPRNIPIANTSESDSIFKKKKKKKKGDKKMVQNDNNFKNDIATLKVEKFYTEICDDDDKHLNKDKTGYSNLSKDEFTKKIPIANTSEVDSLFKKKKKKKKRDNMAQNDNYFKNDIASLKVEKFCTEICDDNNKHLIKDKTGYSNLSKDEFPKNIPIANTSEGDFLFKKKKKKKKGDKKKVQNDNNSKNDIATLKVEKFYTEICDDKDKHLYKDETMDNNFNKDELKRRISIGNISEGDLSLKKKKKKKKLDIIMVQNDEKTKNNIVTLEVEKFYNETCDDNDKHLYKDKILDSNLKKDEFTRRIPIPNASERDLLFKKKRKKTKGDNKMVKKDTFLKNDKATLKVEQLCNETCDENVKYLNKINISASNLNKGLTTRIQIANASEDDEELTLLKSPLKKPKKKKKKSKMAIKDDTESSKYESIQKNLKNMEVLKKYISEEQSNEIHNDPAMINTPYNSRISKVHEEEYPDLFQKLFKNKKKDKKKSIKTVTSKELMSPKKLKKRKRQMTDREYSKNDSFQSVDMDLESYYDSNNSIDDDGEKKLELFDSLDDHTSEYCTMTDTGMYFGQYCNQTFNNDNGVHSHENVLTGNTPLRCEVCFKTLSSKSKLHIHKRTHTGEKPYACDICGNSFSLKGNLYVHKRTHTGEKPYACNVCGRSFTQQSDLVRHKRTHTGEKPYSCDVCGRSFTQQGNLVLHKRTHTGEKPYACNVCGRPFSQQSSLVVHYRIHTGERPYECGHCEKKFSASSDCTRHTRRIHLKCF